ncbi:MAG: hypothetical protein M0042_05230 [Nitrospiraceae bacterium]|nr:hypothetical protein [Nitrospiraceae bacterium]
MAGKGFDAARLANAGNGQFSTVMKGLVLLWFLLLFALLAILNAPPSLAVDSCDCASCHGSSPHGANWSGCSGCHDSPPQTGTHLVHYGSAPLVAVSYSDTGISSTDEGYKFGCGNCHPLDFANHNNGTVNVELYHAAAPAGSLKALNPPTAAYTAGATVSTYANKMAGGASLSYSNGTCNDVYCHSGYAVSSGPVGYPTGTDQYNNATYDPYTVTYTRVYKTTPAWGTSGNFGTCTECHDFPLTTSMPGVQAGVGDSHQWIDDYGYGNLHAFNKGYGALSCRTCHYGIVTQANTWARDGMDVTTYDPVPLASRRLHVNGSRDVQFDTVNLVTYNTSTSLSGATYDGASQSCSNVACHRQQTYVKWGTPYRWWDSTECNLCHSM